MNASVRDERTARFFESLDSISWRWIADRILVPYLQPELNIESRVDFGGFEQCGRNPACGTKTAPTHAAHLLKKFVHQER